MRLVCRMPCRCGTHIPPSRAIRPVSDWRTRNDRLELPRMVKDGQRTVMMLAMLTVLREPNKTVGPAKQAGPLKTVRLSEFLIDLSAYYASLGAQPTAAEIPVKVEIAPAPADDEDEEMEDVSAGPSKSAGPSVPKVPASAAGDKDDEDEFVETPVPASGVNSTEETAEGVDPNTMVMGAQQSFI